MKEATPKKNWRGGARKGAGRPKLGKEKLVPVVVGLSREDVAALKLYALQNGVEKKKLVQEAIRILINAGLVESGLKKTR